MKSFLGAGFKDNRASETGGIGLSLLGLIAVAVLPLVSLIVGVGWTIVDQKKATLASELTNTTRALRVAVDRELLSQIPAMQILATDVSLDKGDLTLFIERAHRAIETHQDWRSIGMIDPKSYLVLATTLSVPTPPPTTLAPRQVDEVVRTRKPLVAGVFAAGRVYAEPMILFLAPVIRQDRVPLVLSVPMNTHRVSDVFVEQGLPLSWTGVAVDQHMRIAGRSREAARFVGLRIAPSLEERIAAADSGMFTALNQEGAAVYTVYSRSPLTGWSVAISIPEAEVDGPIMRLLMRLASVGGVLIALALMLAAVVARGIVRRRKAYERALRESEERFRDLLKNVPNVAVQGYRLDGTTQYWNRASERLYGYSARETIGKNLLELIIPPEMRSDARKAIAQMARTGQPIPATERSLMRKDGSRVPVFSSHTVVQIPGRTPEFFCIDVDLTELKRHEIEAVAARSQLAATLDAIPDLMFEVGLDGRFYDYHSPRSDLLAASPEQFMGKTLMEIMPPAAADVCLSALHEAHETGSSQGKQYELHLSQGKIWFELSVSRKSVDPGQAPRFIVLARDITERKRNEDKYHTVIQASIDGFWITDFFGRILDVNDSICRTLGYERAELLGMTIRDIDVDESPAEIEARTREMIQTGSARFQARHRRKDRTILDVEVSVLYLQTLGERLFAFVRDVTGRKRAERKRAEVEGQLRESQKMEALGTLAGGIAHDFNNIVAAIIGNVELARQDVGPEHPALESLEEIRKASRRAKDLVQQILAFGRRQVLERKVISLAPAVHESARLLRATLPAGISLEIVCAPDTPPVLADANQIEQVLLNLCSNAWQAMQTEARPGTIEIRLATHIVNGTPYCGPERRAKGERAPLRSGCYACLTVRDNGPGMDPATRSRIFEPFFTTKPVGQGTGLGLAVVHGIVQEHDASIVVQSAPGEGATFRIYFPAALPQAASAPAQAADAAGAGQALVLEGEGKHILYLDDDEALVFLMTRLLERQSYRVSGYTDAREALEAVRARPGQFDLVVTDYNMPGMSGLEVARALKEIRPDLPVALASGYITEALRAQAPAAGVRELIYKPDTAEDFCDTVARLVNTLPG